MSPQVHVTRGDSGRRRAGTNAPSFDGSQPCISIELETFFPVDKVEEARIKKELKPICDSCAFYTPCLAWAVDNVEIGIWAATTDDDRRNIRRRAKRQFA